ncbi:hypothetical protein J2X69_005079 [Algoriphagus sp. 4150]|uniref:hypothetical protein n=1 Tax=Algoriphagus sp. 4150 TaxID=2817756 RepID=UPI0028647B86|nr:hypothetical protein [Algoriphagus sp. 4150]MDR7132705.1 hypothetical protein [Algoriphagus sp. 4150]
MNLESRVKNQNWRPWNGDGLLADSPLDFEIHLENGFSLKGAGVLTMLITLLTISLQSVKAALMNPIKSLKSE